MGTGIAGGTGTAEGAADGHRRDHLGSECGLRSIVRRDTGETYDEFLRGLAKASGRRRRRGGPGAVVPEAQEANSNKEWKSPGDGDARIAKMKDGRMHLAHKAQYDENMKKRDIVEKKMKAEDQGDTTTLDETLCEAGEQIAEQIRREVELRPQDKPKVNLQGIEEL